MYIHLSSRMKTQQPRILPTLPCACANFRRAARALTQLYDDAVRPAGLRVTQFTILQALSLTGEISHGGLGALLVMDSTSLTRTLGLLRAKSWIEIRSGSDRRERLVRLSTRGHKQLERATPSWQKAQSRLLAAMGPSQWRALQQITDEVTNRAADTQQRSMQ